MSPQKAPAKPAQTPATAQPTAAVEAEAASLEADLHEAIATLARHRWEEDGRPGGRDLDYWLAAEREVLSRTA